MSDPQASQAQPTKPALFLGPTVEFMGHVSPPWSRDSLTLLTQLPPWKEGDQRRNHPDFQLSQDAVGVHVRFGTDDAVYPWNVIKRAVNVPRAK